MTRTFPDITVKDVSVQYIRKLMKLEDVLTVERLLRVDSIRAEITGMLTAVHRIDEGLSSKFSDISLAIFDLSGSDRKSISRLIAVLHYGPIFLLCTQGTKLRLAVEFSAFPNILRRLKQETLQPLTFFPRHPDVDAAGLEELSTAIESCILGILPNSLFRRCHARGDFEDTAIEVTTLELDDRMAFETYLRVAISIQSTMDLADA